jgi:hypothetical protein
MEAGDALMADTTVVPPGVSRTFGCGCAGHADRVPSDLHGLSSHLRPRPSGRANAASMTDSQPVLYSARVRLGDPLIA